METDVPPNNLATPYVATIDALVLPYNGHKMGGDCAGERFTKKTDFMEEELPNPPVVYAHGYPLGSNPDKAEAQNTVVGRTITRWRDAQGGWAKIGILPGVFADEVIASWKNGTIGFSSTALLKKMSDTRGEIAIWLAGEFSVLTDKTGVPPCNLLARAIDPLKMSKAELATIVAYQPEDLRQNLLDVMGLPDDYLLDTTIASDTFPVLPGADVASNGEIDFNPDATGESSDNGEKDMTPEEITAIVTAAVSPLTAKMDAMDAAYKQKCGCSGDPTPDPTNMSKSEGSIVDYLRQKSDGIAGDAMVSTAATESIDKLIVAGKLDPEKRIPAIKGLMFAINADGRQKMQDGAVDTFFTLLQGGMAMPLAATGDLKKFDFKATQKLNEVKPEDVEMMYQAAITD